jgi:endonuclease/exonuclease/phosphatase family metal-dependent hydrolase
VLPKPGRLSLVVTSALVTTLVVVLGVAFSPRSGAGPEQLRASDLARAALLSAPRAPVEVRSPEADLPVWRAARPVVLDAKPPEKRDRARKRHKAKAEPLPIADFVISSFNVLGSSHTTGARDGKAPGRVRIRMAAQLLAHHGVDVVGLQELQLDQYHELARVAGGTYDFWPGTAAGRLGNENSLAWRTAEWTLVEAHTTPIPYFGGRVRPMPYVLLRHNVSGRYAWFANFHNPATNPKTGNNDRWRARAAALEVSLANRLRDETGYPVFITGDMNEREKYFCAMTGGAAMIAANGGSNAGGCSPPSPMNVDWIFGSDIVDFTDYLRDDGPFVNRISDHPIIVARAMLDAADGDPRPARVASDD